jgi:EmrB/QacA subfamily drug resistance transporter
VSAGVDTAPIPGAMRDRRWWTLAVLCLSLVVITVDNTIVNVALPTLVRSLHADTSELQWIVDAYTVVFAALLLTAGSFGDRRGRRGALTIGLFIFAIGSALSALATSAPELIAMRALTGVGAAFVFPATLSILTSVFTDPHERQRAIAVWAGTAGIGIAIGPLAGGVLLEHFYWGSIFWVNVPIVLIALIGGRLAVPTSRDPNAGHCDLAGVLLSIVGLGALVAAVIEGPDRGWTSAPVLTGFAVALVALAVFSVVELRRADPLLDLRLFRNPRFSSASLAIAVVYFCLFGTIFFLTQHLQFLLGYNALQAGERMLPFAIVFIIVANLTPKFVIRVGTKVVVTAGLLFAVVALLIRAGATVDTTYTALLWSQIAMAVGMGLIIAPATASIMGAVPPDRAGVGSAINDTTRQIGGALGVAIMGSIAVSVGKGTYDRLARAGHVPPAAVAAGRGSLGDALTAAKQLGGPSGARLASAASHAFVDGLRAASYLAAAIALVAAIAVALSLPGRERSETEQHGGEIVRPADHDHVAGVDLVDVDALVSAEVLDHPVLLRGREDRVVAEPHVRDRHPAS